MRYLTKLEREWRITMLFGTNPINNAQEFKQNFRVIYCGFALALGLSSCLLGGEVMNGGFDDPGSPGAPDVGDPGGDPFSEITEGFGLPTKLLVIKPCDEILALGDDGTNSDGLQHDEFGRPGDTLTDYEECILGTNPFDWDSDDDFISDSSDPSPLDINLPDYPTDEEDGSQPQAPGWGCFGQGDGVDDCDLDGINDFNETYDSYDHDSDNDGLRDGLELILGTDPENPDSDGDGRNDGDEIFYFDTDPALYDI
jgi:hypothetical protein